MNTRRGGSTKHLSSSSINKLRDKMYGKLKGEHNNIINLMFVVDSPDKQVDGYGANPSASKRVCKDCWEILDKGYK